MAGGRNGGGSGPHDQEENPEGLDFGLDVLDEWGEPQAAQSRPWAHADPRSGSPSTPQVEPPPADRARRVDQDAEQDAEGAGQGDPAADSGDIDALVTNYLSEQPG